MRPILAVAAAAAVGALGAVIVGEYPFKGVVVLGSGVVFGLFIAEAALGVARRPSRPLAAACAVIGLVAMTWAAWITTGHDLSFLGPAGWASIALTGAAAGLRTAWSRRGAGTPARGPAPPAPSEDSRP
ncbi:MAG: hypothetical protein ACRD2W_08065 [Acidimicrobiales bacterium]